MRLLVLFPAIVALILCLSLTGCRAAECQQMLDCCEKVDQFDGVGGACSGLADDTRDPQTCNDVLRTIGYMLKDRDEPVPEVCQF